MSVLRRNASVAGLIAVRMRAGRGTVWRSAAAATMASATTIGRVPGGSGAAPRDLANATIPTSAAAPKSGQ